MCVCVCYSSFLLANTCVSIVSVMTRFYIVRNTSIRGSLTTFNYLPVYTDTEEEDQDILPIMTEVRPLLCKDILAEQARLRSIKWHIACRIRFTKTVLDGDSGEEKEVTKDAVFHGRCRTLLTDDNDELNCLLDESYDKIMNSISNFTRDGSGWSVDAVLLSLIHI